MIHPIRFARRIWDALARLEELLDEVWDVPLVVEGDETHEGSGLC